MAAEIRLKPAELIAKKYLERTRDKTFYVAGVKNPKRSPTEAALSMKDTWRRKMALPETAEKWAKRRAAAGDEGWLAGIELKGADRWPQGTEFGSAKILDFMNKFLPHLAAGLNQVYKMPRVTLEDSINRAAAMIRHNAKFTYEPSRLSSDQIRELVEKIRGVTV